MVCSSLHPPVTALNCEEHSLTHTDGRPLHDNKWGWINGGCHAVQRIIMTHLNRNLWLEKTNAAKLEHGPASDSKSL